ncbi:MAG: hypothetical protein AAF243_09640 [Cyanobacteria bacterium P01_A01_bin.137]
MTISAKLPHQFLDTSPQLPVPSLKISAKFHYEWEASEPKLSRYEVARWTRAKGWDIELSAFENQINQFLIVPPTPPPGIESWEPTSLKVTHHKKSSTGWHSEMIDWEPLLNGQIARHYFHSWMLELDGLIEEEDKSNTPLADRVKLVTIELLLKHTGCDRYSALSYQTVDVFKYRLFEVYSRLTYPQILRGLNRKGSCNHLAGWLNARKNEGVLIRVDGPSGKIKDSIWSVVSPESWVIYIESHGIKPYSEEQKQTVRDRAKAQAAAINLT